MSLGAGALKVSRGPSAISREEVSMVTLEVETTQETRFQVLGEQSDPSTGWLGTSDHPNKSPSTKQLPQLHKLQKL